MTATVLIIDEDESVTRSLVRLLSVHGIDVHGETSSASAIARAVEILPTVLLIDLHLSHRSGIEIARQIRAERKLAGARLIGMSATVPDWDPDALAVFDAILSKPIPSETLLAAIRG
jgi:DNA-binding response OmpR family regulator